MAAIPERPVPLDPKYDHIYDYPTTSPTKQSGRKYQHESCWILKVTNKLIHMTPRSWPHHRGARLPNTTATIAARGRWLH